MNRALYEELSALAAEGKRFSPEEISSLRASVKYRQSSFTERAFVDLLLQEQAEPPPTSEIPPTLA